MRPPDNGMFEDAAFVHPIRTEFKYLDALAYADAKVALNTKMSRRPPLFVASSNVSKKRNKPLTDLNRRLTIPTHSYTQMVTEPDLAGAGSRLEGRPASRPGGFLI
jgi:hypothetical protein